MSLISKPKRPWHARRTNPYGIEPEPAKDLVPARGLSKPPAAKAKAQAVQEKDSNNLPKTARNEFGVWKLDVRKPPAARESNE